jgi:hypothetical protein
VKAPPPCWVCADVRTNLRYYSDSGPVPTIRLNGLAGVTYSVSIAPRTMAGGGGGGGVLTHRKSKEERVGEYMCGNLH